MAKIYYNRIKAGQITIDDVPAALRPKVQELIDEEARRITDLITDNS